MKNITIYQDTAEKKGKKEHILKYFEEQGIRVRPQQLNVGDYTISNKHDICIDIKQDVLEICGNICGKDHTRFRNECIRAMEDGINLIILIEEDYTLETLKNWTSPAYKSGDKKGQQFIKVNGERLAKSMITMSEKYGCTFLFTSKKKSGENILKLLLREEDKNEL